MDVDIYWGTIMLMDRDNNKATTRAYPIITPARSLAEAKGLAYEKARRMFDPSSWVSVAMELMPADVSDMVATVRRNRAS